MTSQMAQERLSTDPVVSESDIDAAIDAVERVMLNVVNSQVTVLREASKHILSAGGKRVRPRLSILSYMALGGTDYEYAAPAAAAIELMHTASVVHDDINDHGVLRRGRPSVNAKWGRTFALLTGDFLFTSVYQLMAPYGTLNKILADAATALVEGETLQAEAVKNGDFTRSKYAEIIALKTAALFQAAGELGARLADATAQQIEAIQAASYNIGLAFQIVDDILDIIGDEATLGKTAGIDIEQGRGFVSAQTNGHKTGNGADAFESVKSKLMQGEYLEEARMQAKGLVEMAIMQFNTLPESPARSALIDLANQVVDRDF